jgi:neutral ceramidase
MDGLDDRHPTPTIVSRRVKPGRRRAWARRRAALVLGLCAAGATAGVRAAPLQAAVARVDITPPPGFLMDGYPDPDSKRVGTGARDPLYARVLILQSADTRLAVVDLDLVEVLGPESMARLREATRPDVSHLLVVAIHTHSGPPLDASPASPVGAWYGATVDKIAAAVHTAAARTAPVRLGVGYGVAYLGHNRLRIEHDGGVSWFEKNWVGTPNAQVDPTVAVLRLDSAEGTPLAVLVNYACHPVIYGPDNRLYSADFPGVTTDLVQRGLGGQPLCFYLQGGAGDINPTHAVSTLPQGAVQFCREAGTELGEAVLRVARGIQTSSEADSSLQVAEDTLALKPRWNARAWAAARPEDAALIAQVTKPRIEAPVTTVLINRRLALVALPGEPFVEFQLDWRARCPVPDSLFLGYANVELDYFPTIRAASWGGYGASHPSTWVEVGAGERMVDQGLVRIYEMLGRLKPAPSDVKP